MSEAVAFSELDHRLEDLLNSLSGTQLRKAMREIAKYLRQKNLHRITKQENADGTRYTPRKNKRVRRKMLTGFKKNVKQRVDMRQLEVGIFGHAAKLAHVHHAGETEDGVRYPSRQLITLSDEDKQAIYMLLIEHLTN